MHKYSDLKPKQKEFIHIIRDAMVQDEGIDMDDMKTSSFSRACVDRQGSFTPR